MPCVTRVMLTHNDAGTVDRKNAMVRYVCGVPDGKEPYGPVHDRYPHASSPFN